MLHMATKNIAISVRFTKELGESITAFCKNSVRNKTDVVNAAAWYLLNRPEDEIEVIVKKFGSSGGKLNQKLMEDLGKSLRRAASGVSQKKKGRAGRSAG